MTRLPFIKGCHCHCGLEKLHLIVFSYCPVSVSVTAEALSATALDFCETKDKCWALRSGVGVIPILCMNYK